MRCNQCPRKCGAERLPEKNGGICGAPELPKIARAALHFWEEPAISGKNGSGTIFFSGCPLKCIFCQNQQISRGGVGEVISIEQLAKLMKGLEAQGAHNINFVTPTHYVHAIRSALELYRPRIPIVYNCGGYERAETLRTLDGLVDIYLPDLKYSDDVLSAELSGAKDYFPTATEAIREMFRQTGKAVYDKNGMLLRGTVVRHLILPGHIRNTIGVLKWLRDELPDVTISVMAQYFPIGKFPEHPELERNITKKEHERVLRFLENNNMTNGWVQDTESADASYVPKFYSELPALDNNAEV